MNPLVSRPPATPAAGRGVLRHEHFQIAYVTSDLDAACARFARQYGIGQFKRHAAEIPEGGNMEIALAWSGGTMYELIQASGPAAEFYNRRLPDEGFAIRHHHLGFFVQNQEEWDELEQDIAQGEWTIASEFYAQGFMRACYIDAPDLGHYLEYILPEPAGIAFFEAVPVN